MSTAQLNTIYRLNGGEEWFKARTNPDATVKPTTVDTDAVEDATSACEAWFARRGYDLTRTDGAELFQWVGLWVVAQHLWTQTESDKYARMLEQYPVTFGGAVSTGIAAGDDDDRRHFTDTKLDALDQIRVRQTKRQPGGGF